MHTSKHFAMICALVLGTLGAAALPETSAPNPEARLTPTVQAVEKAMPSVVNIGTETMVEVQDLYDQFYRQFFDPYHRGRRESRYELGSGVIIDEDGFVLTNDHVVRRADRVWVKLTNGKEYQADVLVSDSNTDVALLKLRINEGEKFQAIEFAEPDDLLLGETVIALGNPFGLGGSVSKGILSSKNRRPPMEGKPLDVNDWLQVDAAINPGNSGGPLINLSGQLIGLNVAMVQSGQGIGFAIPIRQVSKALSHTLTPEGINGMWFGAHVSAGTTQLEVLDIEPDSPAELAGLRVGDQILEVKGQRPRNFIEFNRLLLRNSEGHDVDIRVRRGLSEKQVSVRLIPEADFFNAELIRKRLGLSIQRLTRELADAMNYRIYGGFVIAGVEKGSPADRARLEPGDVIRGFDGRFFNDLKAAARLLHQKAKGDKVAIGRVFLARGRFGGLQLAEEKVELTIE